MYIEVQVIGDNAEPDVNDFFIGRYSRVSNILMLLDNEMQEAADAEAFTCSFLAIGDTNRTSDAT